MNTSKIFRSDLLQGKVALVTGGGTGIGAAITRELARLGARVTIASRKQEHIGPAAAGLSAELGVPVAGARVDIRDRDSVQAVVTDVLRREGRLDILINNGGGQFLAPAETISPRGWDAVVQTNLTGTWNLTRAAADQWMLDHGGSVVNITMLTARGFPGMAHSVAARSGVEGLTRTLAVEWATRGVRCNCVAPGIIATSGLKNYPDGLELGRQLQAHTPMKRLGTAEEIAWTVAFLAGPAAAYTTGQTLIVDGGRTLWGDTWPIPDPEAGLPDVVLPVEAWEQEG